MANFFKVGQYKILFNTHIERTKIGHLNWESNLGPLISGRGDQFFSVFYFFVFNDLYHSLHIVHLYKILLFDKG